MTLQCLDCSRRFADENALWQHRKFSHKKKGSDNPHPIAARDENEIGYADIALEAQRKQASGDTLLDWEEPYRY